MFVCVCECLCVLVWVSRFPCGGFKVLVWSCSVPPEPPFPGPLFPGPPFPWTPFLWTPFPWTAQNFAFFFPSPAAKFVLFFLTGCLLVEFWCFEDRGPQMCTFGFSGCRVREEKNEFCGGTGEKKRENLGPPTLPTPTLPAPHPSGPHPSGPHPSGPPPFGAPLFLGWASHPSNPHPSNSHPSGPHFLSWAPHPSNPHLSPPTHVNSKHTKTINFKKPKQLTPKNQNLYIQLKP